MTKKSKIILQVFVALFCLATFLITETYINSQRNNEYPCVENQSSLEGVVCEVIKKKGSSYITLCDGMKILLLSSQNRHYSEEYLSENIFEGDSIVKHRHSDTIEIYREAERYFFIHKQVIK